jgi:lysophospholipase L1-like esterase
VSRRKNNRALPPSPTSELPSRLSRRRYILFFAITLLAPFLVLGVVEGVLRLAHPDGGLPLFVPAKFVSGDYLVANHAVGQRWFGGIADPPAPAPEMFSATKPERAFRVFVLGESAAAGFPYPRNATFSRLLRDVLRDVMPGDSVEVVNLGIAATNSFAMLDMAREVRAQRPDAVLIYAGHNEYYGALGAASRVAIPGGASVERLYLKLLRLRIVLALRNAFTRPRTEARTQSELEEASLMEVLARDKQVPLGSPEYQRGVKQFESNLEALIRVFRSEKIPVFVGSVASNLRNQTPFAAAANAIPNGADAAFLSARMALARGDSAQAATLYARARDLDVVRFRAPGEFNRIIHNVTQRTGAVYVPVAEAFAAASPAGIPGSNLFLEHVHPNRQGYALIGRVFFESLASSGLLRGALDTTRLRAWDEYERGMDLTSFDERIALHTTRTITSRWPFVPVAEQKDYRGTYVPTDLLDSLAFSVSRGGRWELAKIQLAADYERRQKFDSAAAEYAGLARDAPLVAEPARRMARDLALAGKSPEADSLLPHAGGDKQTAASLAALGTAAAKRRQIPEAIGFFRRSLDLKPAQPDVLYKLTLAYGVAHDLSNARATATRLGRIAPSYPGLFELKSALGMR